MVDQLVARAGKGTISISVVGVGGFKRWVKTQSKSAAAWLKATDFVAKDGAVALLPDRSGGLGRAVLTVGANPSPWSFARLASALPKAKFAFDKTLPAEQADNAALGFALEAYRFSRYKKDRRRLATLVWPEGADVDGVTAAYEGIALGRDLVNTPAEDLGPAELCQAGLDLAKRHGAKAIVIKGKGLLDKGFPTIHAVGRAATKAPALLDITWGDENAPKLTLVGKGVTFDSGGLDLKSAAGMKLMKKDMGGAASVLAIAHMVMAAGLPCRLRVLIPTVENAVAGDAYRPGDVLTTRKGLTVEVGNTDAEGRLILCDALAEASEERPDLLIDFATLTGAARVALGVELPALFCNDDEFANSVLEAGVSLHDPLWRMPLHTPYRRHLDSKIADLNNIANVSTGGAITAALFLKEFVGPKTRWAHVDTMAFNNSTRPGRPAGGEILGARAFFTALERRYGA